MEETQRFLYFLPVHHLLENNSELTNYSVCRVICSNMDRNGKNQVNKMRQNWYVERTVRG